VLQINSQGYATGFEEKPRSPKPMFRKSAQALVSMGIYVFDTQALVDAVSDDAQRNSSHDFGHDIIPRFIHNRRLSVFNFTETGTRLGSYWRDVGTLDAYYSANMELLLTSFFDGGAAWPTRGFGAQYPSVPRTVTDAAEIVDSIVPDDAWVAPGSRVIHSVLSPGVRIESTAAVQNSILLPNVHVGAGARVHRAILDDGVRVAEGAIVGFDRDCDRPYDFVTDNGIVAIPAHTYVENLQSVTSTHLQWKHFVSEDPFKTRQVR
jgi:glucose-1-phosphate adenylyltransferase